jgi:hypothetical protein
VLGLWIEQTEGAKFWLRVMNELKDRGVADILIAVVDGLKGFPEAIAAVFPRTQVQACVVHLIRSSLDFVSYKDRKTVAAALKEVYRAHNAEAGQAALEAFDEGPWGRKYPVIAQAWRRHWGEVIPFYAFPSEVRRIVYTTNAIEALNAKLRRAVRARGHFPTDEAALKLLFLVLRQVSKDWKMPAREWTAAKAQFAILFETASPPPDHRGPHTKFLTLPSSPVRKSSPSQVRFDYPSSRSQLTLGSHRVGRLSARAAVGSYRTELQFACMSERGTSPPELACHDVVWSKACAGCWPTLPASGRPRMPSRPNRPPITGLRPTARSDGSLSLRYGSSGGPSGICNRGPGRAAALASHADPPGEAPERREVGTA